MFEDPFDLTDREDLFEGLPPEDKNVFVDNAEDMAAHRSRMEYAFGMRDTPAPGQSPTDEIVRRNIVRSGAVFSIEDFDQNGWDADPYLLSLDQSRPIGG